MTPVSLFCDLDGVIFDSYDLWDRVMETLLAGYGVAYTPVIRDQLWQLSMPQAQSHLLTLTGAQSPDQLERDKQQLLREAYASVPLVAGARDFLQAMAELSIPVFAVTSNQSDLARLGLDSQGLLPYFRQVYSCLDYAYEDKDSRFLQTVCQLENLDPHDLFLLEDSPNNLLSASSLGIKGFLLKNSLYAPMTPAHVTVLDHLEDLYPYVKGKKT